MDAHARDRAADPTASILVVDDESFVRRIVGRLLERAGYRVALAGDGREALAILSGSASGFDLVLTDVRMPGMEGPELMTLARRIQPDLAFVFMTGSYGVSPPAGDGHGPASIIKPFGWTELDAAVRAALDDAPALP